jgi:hypothetical protein
MQALVKLQLALPPFFERHHQLRIFPMELKDRNTSTSQAAAMI